MKKLRTFLSGIILVTLGLQPVSAQDWGSIVGTVYVSDGEIVVTDAKMTLVGLNYSQRVNESGQFAFEEVPAGSILLRAESPTWGRNSETVTVVAGETITIDLEVLMHMELEEIIVTAGPTALTRPELVNPVNVLTGSDLLESHGLTLGESLKNQPGLASTYYGPGASRPIIGGVGGSRVKVLQHGLNIGDVSDQSEDHAVGVDAFDASRIEIIRGPAALLYGSDITGGVVNVLDGRIPSERPVNRIEGMIMERGGLGANERGGGGRLTGAFGNLVWRAHGLMRETGNVSTPMFNPEGIHEDHNDHGDDDDHGDDNDHGDHDGEAAMLVNHIENSNTALSRGSFGMSWLGRRGYIGAAVSFHNTDYGIPGGHDHHDHGDDDHDDHGDHDDHEGEVSTDMDLTKYDMEGAYRLGDGVLQGVRFRLGVADYTHSEMEGGEAEESNVGITYDNNHWEGRFELDHSPYETTRGVLGVQVKRRDMDISSGDHGALPSFYIDHRCRNFCTGAC